jgi:YVTN family beta-propeller protein
MLKINVWISLVSLVVLTACAKIGISTPSFVTADEAGNTLTKIDSSGTRQTLAVPAAPHNVQVGADGRLLLVTGMPGGHEHAGHTMPGTLLIIPTDSFSEQSIRSISLGQHLAHVVTDASEKTAYVTDSGNNTLTIVDIDSGVVIDTIKIGAFPHGARINPVRDELYTANVKDGTVSVVDLQARKEVRRIPVGRKPIQVAVTPDGKKLYVTLAKDSAVAVIDLTMYKKTATIPVPNAPAQIYADSLGRYVVTANQGSTDRPGKTISVIDANMDKIIRNVPTGQMPHGVVISADGRYAYITNMGEDTVAKVDMNNFSILATYKVGKLPNGITLVE